MKKVSPSLHEPFIIAVHIAKYELNPPNAQPAFHRPDSHSTRYAFEVTAVEDSNLCESIRNRW